jgi:hypothetical protein
MAMDFISMVLKLAGEPSETLPKEGWLNRMGKFIGMYVEYRVQH